jgi:hypothetical protein
MWTPAAVVAVNTRLLEYDLPSTFMLGARKRDMVRNAVNESASRSFFTFSTHTSGTLPRRSLTLLERVLTHARAGPYEIPAVVWLVLYAEPVKAF